MHNKLKNTTLLIELSQAHIIDLKKNIIKRNAILSGDCDTEKIGEINSYIASLVSVGLNHLEFNDA
ncbi:MAG: hypothetical protein COB41_05610 [Proteobacteria bacterium]|nr:MAG: hypothetical protein COB41_05510 [Pseudomonadota bacterium]PCI44013.1 MAG: hypothetical protein COB41_05610 [Pseudomonadota bacterium]